MRTVVLSSPVTKDGARLPPIRTRRNFIDSSSPRPTGPSPPTTHVVALGLLRASVRPARTPYLLPRRPRCVPRSCPNPSRLLRTGPLVHPDRLEKIGPSVPRSSVSRG